MESKIAAVVVTYNRISELQRCINQLILQTKIIDSIYIINNFSTDSTSDYLISLKSKNPNFHIYNLEKNMGGSYGFCYGIERALADRNDYIWIMDDDCFADSDCLEKLMEALKEKEQMIVAASPVVLCKDGNIDLYHRRNVKCPILIEHPIDKIFYSTEKYINCPSSSFVGPVFSSAIFEIIGLPDKDLFFQFDDTEFFARLNKEGYRNLLVTEAVVTHGGSPTYPPPLNISCMKVYYSIRNKIITSLKYNPPIYILIKEIFKDFLRFSRNGYINQKPIIPLLNSMLLALIDGLMAKKQKRY